MKSITIKLQSEHFSKEQKIELPLISPPDFLNSIDETILLDSYLPQKNSSNYNRITLYHQDGVEVVFCHWQKGQTSEKHFHENKSCWFKCVKGSLSETRDGECNTVENNKVYYIDDSIGPHQVTNKSQRCTYTLHYYQRNS